MERYLINKEVYFQAVFQEFFLYRRREFKTDSFRENRLPNCFFMGQRCTAEFFCEYFHTHTNAQKFHL